MPNVGPASEQPFRLFIEVCLTVFEGTWSTWRGIINVLGGLFKIFGFLVINAGLLFTIPYRLFFIVIAFVFIIGPAKLRQYVYGSGPPAGAVSTNNAPSLLHLRQ